MNNNRELSIKSAPLPLPLLHYDITPPPLPDNHSSDKSYSFFNKHLEKMNNYEQLEKILNINLKLDDKEEFTDLNAFCYSIIKKKFQESVKQNYVLPCQSDKKHLNLKIFQHSNSSDIKTKIISTINSSNNPDPKISEFIDKSIDLLLLDQMTTLERSIVSLHNKTFHQIQLSSTLKTKFFSSNYFQLNIQLLSINFL